MQKRLPRQTARSLNPPANVLEPYTFFKSVREHPLQPHDSALNQRNAWWLADAALLAYSSDSDVGAAFRAAGISGDVAHFRGPRSTQAYVISMTDAIVLAFRGTQVDNFWSSVRDFTVNAQFVPERDSHRDLVHAGFLGALQEVWTNVAAHLKHEQARSRRPLWITGHSLGGALATLAANLCSDDEVFQLKGVYTFGSPRVGDPGFGARIRVPVFRFANDSDIVPHLPPPGLYHHVGHLQFIDGAGHFHQDLASAMEILLDPGAPLLAASDALTMLGRTGIDSALDLPLPGFLADHAPLNYSVLVWNIYDRSMPVTGAAVHSG